MHLLVTNTFRKVGEWIRKPVSIWCDHHLPQAVRQISFTLSWSGCRLWPVECCPTPLQRLYEITGYWRELEHAVMHADSEHPKHEWHVWWVCRPWKNWDSFSFQELCTDHCDNSLAPTLVDIPAVSMPISCSLKTWDILWHCVVWENCTF
jgi:hypothetical protein